MISVEMVTLDEAGCTDRNNVWDTKAKRCRIKFETSEGTVVVIENIFCLRERKIFSSEKYHIFSGLAYDSSPDHWKFYYAEKNAVMPAQSLTPVAATIEIYDEKHLHTLESAYHLYVMIDEESRSAFFPPSVIRSYLARGEWAHIYVQSLSHETCIYTT